MTEQQTAPKPLGDLSAEDYALIIRALARLCVRGEPEQMDALDLCARLQEVSGTLTLHAGSTALADTLAEREYQRERWGDDHDDTHDAEEWACWIGARVERLPARDDQRAQLVRIAAMALAAAESMDRIAEK